MATPGRVPEMHAIKQAGPRRVSAGSRRWQGYTVRMWKSALCSLVLLALFPASPGSSQGLPDHAKPLTRYVSHLRTESKFSSDDFVPDGLLDKAVWRRAVWKSFDRDAFDSKRFPQSKTEAASFWTTRYVYFAFRCEYTTLNVYQGEDPAPKRWELWNRDVVEVFANPDPERVNHYYEFEVAPNNQWIDLEIDLDKTPFNDASWNSGFEHATRVDAGRHQWTCEMRIPVRALGVDALRPNADWRINFFRADGPSDGPQRRLLSWSPIRGAKRTFHAPANFGLVRFVK